MIDILGKSKARLIRFLGRTGKKNHQTCLLCKNCFAQLTLSREHLNVKSGESQPKTLIKKSYDAPIIKKLFLKVSQHTNCTFCEELKQPNNQIVLIGIICTKA